MFEYTQEMADQLTKSLENVEIKADDDKDWSFDVIATTENADRDGEMIKIRGWDTTNWEKNPVVLANHKYTIENIVGKGTKFYTSNGTKRLKGVFSKTNPLGVLAKELYNEGMLKAVSVGFIVKERDPNDRAIITKAELLEVSFVAIPCNPEALSLDQKKLLDEAVEKGLEIEVIETEEKEITIKDINSRLDNIESMLKTLVEQKEEEKEEAVEAIEEKKIDPISQLIADLKGITL